MDFFFHVGAAAHAGYHEFNDFMSSDSSSSSSSSSSSESSANSSDSSSVSSNVGHRHGEYNRITPRRERDKNDPFRHHHDYDDIQLIKNNDESIDDFSLSPASAEEMDDTTCELLGRYISENDHLTSLDLSSCLNDARMTSLFRGLVSSNSIRDVDLSLCHSVRIGGIQSMIPFLRDSSSINKLDLECVPMNAQSLEVLLDALQRRSTIEELKLNKCSIESISVFESYTIPSLKYLNLKHNRITSIPSLQNYSSLETLNLGYNNLGADIEGGGILPLTRLLERDDSNLSVLHLTSTCLNDTEVEQLTQSLKSNTKLTELSLAGRQQFGPDGKRALLKLLLDVSSLDNIISSNHTLTSVSYPKDGRIAGGIESMIECTLKMNYKMVKHAVAKIKVVYTLDEMKRMQLSLQQGFGECVGHPFIDIDPAFLLPNALALAGNNRRNHDEFYRLLVATSPDLMSLLDRRALLQVGMEKNTSQIADIAAQIAALNARMSSLKVRGIQMKEQLSAIQSSTEQKPVAVLGGSNSSGKKRDRGE